MNILVITLIVAKDRAKELPDYEERDGNKVVLVNSLK
jgi:hypothetical protein